MKGALASVFAILSIIAGITIYTNLKNNQIIKKKVYMDMDGNNDDFVAFLLLLNFHKFELVGIAITRLFSFFCKGICIKNFI